jgi:hypothetical protein
VKTRGVTTLPLTRNLVLRFEWRKDPSRGILRPLDRRWSSSEIRACIANEQCKSQHTSEPCSWCWWVWSEWIWWVNPRSLKSNWTCGQSMVNLQWNPCLCHPNSNIEYSTVATTLQTSCSRPSASVGYHILTHSELSHVSFLFTKIVASNDDTSWFYPDE